MKKKKLHKIWKKRFIEFLMLFLAITLGFFADNLRDSFTNSSQEKEYIISMIEDAKNDKINIKKILEYNKQRKNTLDSLTKNCFYFDSKKENITKKLYKYYMFVLLKPDFLNFSELTIQQLKNAGGLRLIKNKKAVEAIVRYDLAQQQLENQQKYYETYQNKTIDMGMNIFNYQFYVELEDAFKKGKKDAFLEKDLNLLSTDALQLKKFSNHSMMYSGVVEYYSILLENINTQADSLINTLEKEYKLKK